MGRLRYAFGVLTSTDLRAPVRWCPSWNRLRVRRFPPHPRSRTTLALDNNPVTTHFAARAILASARAGPVEIAMYDVTGRRVRTLARRIFPAGDHALT